MMKLTILIIISLAFANTLHAKPSHTTAILGAMPEEIAIFKEKASDLDSIQVNGYTFFTGKSGAHEIVFTSCGIGKVNAAITTTLLIQQFSPKRIIMTGIAGALSEGLMPGDVVVASHAMHHDFGLQQQTISPWATQHPHRDIENPMWLPCDSTLTATLFQSIQSNALPKITLPNYTHTPQIMIGKIATGDQFIDDKYRKEAIAQLGADAVEMEGAAVAQCCYQFDVPFVLVRSISDRADGSAEVTYDQLKPIVAKQSAEMVWRFIKTLSI